MHAIRSALLVSLAIGISHSAPAEQLLPIARQDTSKQPHDTLPPLHLDPSKKLRIVIDIGHFLPNPDSATEKGRGATSARGVNEFYFNRPAALALAQALRDTLGCEVLVDNEDGKEHDLRHRTSLAHEQSADLFFSVHHDAVQASQLTPWIWEGKPESYCDAVHGFSLFVSDSCGNYPQALALARRIGASLRKGGRSPNIYHSRKIPGEERQLLDSLNGVYLDRLAVLVSARMPAILIECGMLVNRDEELQLDSNAYRAGTGALVASALRRWLAEGAPEDTTMH